MAPSWTPNSWRNVPILQLPTYEDQALLASVEADLQRQPRWCSPVKCAR